jgi:PAS domain S-box-containing protein
MRIDAASRADPDASRPSLPSLPSRDDPGHADDGRAELEHRLDRMAAVLYEAEVAIVSMTLDGLILTWNRGAQHMYGYADREAVGRPMAMLLPAELHEDLKGWLSEVRHGSRVRRETNALTNRGRGLDVALTMSPQRASTGVVDGVSLITRDMTQERWMAATLQSTLDSLETALVVAKESESQSRRFLADAAHQLRTPIAGIRSSAETLLRESDPETREQLLANILRETSRAARLMGSLLRMARLEQGEMPIPQPCDLVGLCRDEVDRVTDVAPQLQVAIRVEKPFTKLPEVDPHLVREILANVLDNARRHAARRIDLIVEEDEATVVVRVVDDGPGLAPELALRAFERFVSLDGHGGSGLGLAIARGLARAQDGDLAYEGRAFVLRLPLRPKAVDCSGGSPPSGVASI